MVSFIITDGQYIEKERFNIIVQSFVIEKQLGKKAQVLAVYFRPIAINFKYGYVVSSIDFIAWRLTQVAFVL